MKIKGVGAKVAECTLLFGFGRVDAFPIDVWVRRVVGELYPNGLPECMDGVRGIAQRICSTGAGILRRTRRKMQAIFSPPRR